MITIDTVRKVAQIARISVTDKELKEFSKDLNSVLSAFRDLEKAGTKGVKPTFQPIEVKNITRDDAIEDSLRQADALKNTNNREDGNFLGPKVV